jgi:hypothetical protein
MVELADADIHVIVNGHMRWSRRQGTERSRFVQVGMAQVHGSTMGAIWP